MDIKAVIETWDPIAHDLCPDYRGRGTWPLRGLVKREPRLEAEFETVLSLLRTALTRGPRTGDELATEARRRLERFVEAVRDAPTASPAHAEAARVGARTALDAALAAEAALGGDDLHAQDWLRRATDGRAAFMDATNKLGNAR